MRRAEREITDHVEIDKIIDQCKTMRLGLTDGLTPYVVPLSFGYCREKERYCFYFHCASEGKKLALIEKNPSACIELDCGWALISAETACGYGCAYQSVIGLGTAEIIATVEEKKKALSLLMERQTGRVFSFTDEMAASVTIGRVVVTELTAKAKK
ncbi:MAG: pyridoxamine 5'-phosphate oxidase family protein [Eubacteriales bacterium]|nr:pyridoxamine 5'-phosphate oxidase family protein [Eubacteriales bacterium]